MTTTMPVTIEEWARVALDLTAERDRLRDLLRQAHDAMMAWHFVHGGPDAIATAEERAMGAACRAIQEQGIVAALDVAGGPGMRLRTRRSPPELELVAVQLDDTSSTSPLSWLKERPDGRYAMLLRAFDDTPPHAIAVEEARPGSWVHVVRPKR